ncbi:GNAT family N-acetyltransferase [Kitasatospora acidiphila]|uniref:GNAT family N-acetyltransferase n=1 Tax=Kitasatospora acidiphila TaxID=2567942 RepID=A0A540WES6_9ACTN|nr:GNAT family N-acetyltransferase [Kitasatospora acidiphila]
MPVSLTASRTAVLRPLEPHHAVEYLAHIDRARNSVDRFVPWASRTVDLDSTRSLLQQLAIAQRVGMTLEGVQRSSFPHGGMRHDMEVWAVLAEEWRAAVPGRFQGVS